MESLAVAGIDIGRLAELSGRKNLELDDSKLEKFQKYSQILLDWNSRINLTAITMPEQIEVKHFVDSMLLAAREEVQGSLVDVGSGAGFPGLVAKIYRPQLRVTLVEPTGKRVQFLQAAVKELELDACVVKERAEEAGRKVWREKFDVATARAVAALNVLCEYCLPLVKVGGFFIAMKGAEEEPVPNNALEKLGAVWLETVKYSLPDSSQRSMVIMKKISPTPPQYPRNGGVIAKRPL